MIVGVTGHPGSGKSLLLATVAVRELLARPWLRLATNLELCDHDLWQGSFKRVVKLHDPPVTGKREVGFYYVDQPWLVPPGHLLIVDEVDDVFDSLDFAREQTGAFRSYIKQHRKLGHNWVWSTQNFQNVYIRLRRQTHKMIHCSNTKQDWVWKYAPTAVQFFIRSHYAGVSKVESQLIGTEKVPHFDALRYRVIYSTASLHGRAAVLLKG